MSSISIPKLSAMLSPIAASESSWKSARCLVNKMGGWRNRRDLQSIKKSSEIGLSSRYLETEVADSGATGQSLRRDGSPW